MNEKYKQQRNDTNHRKLVRSPDKLPPCDFDTLFHDTPATATAQFTTSAINSKKQHDTFTTSSSSRQKEARSPQSHPYPIACNQKSTGSTSLPPSLSAPSIALLRKPSISIKYSEDNCDIHQLEYSKFIDSTKTSSVAQQHQSELYVDQSSNNPSSPTGSNTNVNIHQQQQPCHQINQTQQQQYDWFADSSNSAASTKFDIYLNQRQQQSSELSQSHDFASSFVQTAATAPPTRGQMIFNHNNPFLDSFETSTTDVNGQIDNGSSFFNIDDANESNFLYLVETTSTAVTKTCVSSVEEEELSLRDKRENFATTSTKFCLVVSPPSNKFQVSCNFFSHD